MRIKIIQKFIDMIRGNEYKPHYKNFKETLEFLSLSLNIDRKLYTEILNHSKLPRYFYKKDVERMQKYINTINANDIKANCKLRSLQMRILDFVNELIPNIEKNGIQPMLFGGSLLGAVRHGGFLPWDDDIDFDIMRNDWDNLLDYIKKEYTYYEATNICTDNEYFEALDKLLKENKNKIVFCRKLTGLRAYKGTSLKDVIVIDFFCRDYLNDNITIKEYLEYRRNCNSILQKLNNWGDYFSFFDKESKNEKYYSNDGIYTVRGWDNYRFIMLSKATPILKSDIFPLKKIKFENNEFWTMNNYEKYFRNMYNNYLQIPIEIELAPYLKTFDGFLKSKGNRYYITLEEILNKVNYEE